MTNPFLHGIDLFNQAKFFDAHEALEDVWRAAPAPEKKFYQGLIQAAVAFHHHSTGNHRGMRSVLERSIKNLTHAPENFPQHNAGVHLPPLLHSLSAWRDAVDHHHPPPPLPRITLKR